MPDDLRDLIARDIDRIDLPPPASWTPGARARRAAWWRPILAVPAFAGVIVLALAVALVIQLARGQVPVPVAASPSPSASPSVAAASPSPSATQTAAPSVEPSASPRYPPGPASDMPDSGIRLQGKLPPSGRWAIVVRRSYTYVAPPPTGQIVRAAPSVDALVAVSLDDPSAKPIELLSYISAADGVPMPSNLLRSQFSPDGRRLVLSVIASSGSTSHAGIVIVDLIAGTATPLASDPRYNDVTPAWRPNGGQVAFVRSATGAPPASTDARIVLIGADGAGFREVLPPSTSRIDATLLLRWNGDGSGITYLRGFERSPLYVLDLATGRSGIVGEPGRVTVGRGAVDWRGATPAFAGTLTEGPSGPVRFLAVADGQLATPSRDVVVLPSSGVVNLGSPRWRPASNEILYVQTTNEPSSLSQLFLTDATGAAPRELLRVNSLSLLASWTADGRQIVYLRGDGSGQEVHLLNADGTGDRAVGSVGGSVVPEAPSAWPDLAVLSL